MARKLLATISVLMLAVLMLAVALAEPPAPLRAHAAPPAVGLLTIDGAIGPASADYLVRGIARAGASRYGLVIIRMDTPGGLDTAMRTAIKAILTSPVPVVTWVAPGGARAASAGTYILYASHVAAMAPGTNLGAATPVEIGIGGPQEPAQPRAQPPPARGNAGERGDTGGRQTPAAAPAEGPAMTRKAVNDAAAYLRGLAQLRGRNADWAERAVREAVSLTAAEALRQGVIEIVAADLPSLLAQLDGRSVLVLGAPRRLSTQNAAVVELLPDWRTEVLGVIANPSLALLLMTIGVYGLVFEFMNPGYVAPGVIGAICLLLGLYALQMLPVNYAGLALIFLGLVFMGAEAFLPSFGVLGLGGVVAFVAGGLMLVDTALPGYGIPPVLIGTLAIASALLLAGSARLALATRRRPVTSGAASLIGALATVENVTPLDPHAGWVRIEGELWQAASDQPLRQARAVRIVARSGLVLHVETVDPQPGAAS